MCVIQKKFPRDTYLKMIEAQQTVGTVHCRVAQWGTPNVPLIYCGVTG